MIFDVNGNEITVHSDEQAQIDALNNMVGASTSAGVFDYEIGRLGVQDSTWSWWTRPICEHFVGVRDRVYYGYTTHDGFAGVGMYDPKTGIFQKTHLKKNEQDDHNAAAVLPRTDRKILVAYPSGHNVSNKMYVRLSKYTENITEWDDPVELTCSPSVSYAQLLYVNSKYWLFYRSTNYNWIYRTSSDGVTWSDERFLVTAAQQYYVLAVPTNDSSRIRFCCTANPQYSDTNIRMGFIDTSTEAVYNADNSTVVRAGTAAKTSGITNTNFTTIIAAPGSGSQRLFDVRRGTAPGSVYILYATYSTNTDSAYYIYNNGTTTKLCDGGAALWNPKYQLGATFVGSDKIVVARNSSGSDIIEIVDYSGTLDETLHTEANGTLPIRNARPVASSDGDVVMWQRGYYNSSVYTDFDMDAYIEILTNA